MRVRTLLRGLIRPRRTAPPSSPEAATPQLARDIELRIDGRLFHSARSHVENFARGEEAGFLLCSLGRRDGVDALLARAWRPIPNEALQRNTDGSVLSWSANFNSAVVEEALALDATPVLVHSHGTTTPTFSGDDRRNEVRLFGAISRLVAPLPTGTLLLGDGRSAGSFWLGGRNDPAFARLVVVDDVIRSWPANTWRRTPRLRRRRLTRQTAAIGPESDALLAHARVAVIGVSGGGSHVAQQLIHQGVGTLLPVDDQLVDESNLGRLVGATHNDIDITPKTAVVRRLAAGVDPAIDVIETRHRFPSQPALVAMKSADVVVACVDTFQAREMINAFCRRYLIPLVDIGISVRSSGDHLAVAQGQVITSLPGRPCLRCWFLTDAVLEKERRERPLGYDRNPDRTGDPQVVSMNGTLASEACNCVLDLITGYSGGRRGAAVWQYDGRIGELIPSDLPAARDGCPGCAEEAMGDPPHTL